MSASFEPARRPFVLAGLCALLGLVFIFGGARLVALGGSSYYLLLGLALLATGVLTWIRHPAAAWLFAATTLCTLVWAITESGFDAWALLPRVVPLATLGLWFALPGCSARSPPAGGPQVQCSHMSDGGWAPDCSWQRCC